MRSKDADKLGDLVNDPKVFDLDEPDLDVFLSLHEWIQNKVKANLDFEGSDLEKMLKEHSPKDEKKQDKSEEKKEESSDDEDW